jgi:hypothetical protein
LLIFKEIDNGLDVKYEEWLNSENYMREKYRFEHFFGLGPYIRSKYIYNNSDIKYIIQNNTYYRNDDDMGGLIKRGFILYKKRIFDVFKTKGHFA